MKLSEIESTLREIRVSPVKTLGQNFLHDQNLARWIVERAELTSEDYVVEIGPGLGALTEFVLASGAQVLAIEKDARLVGFLRERFAGKRLEIIHRDALEFDVRTLFAQPRVKFIANLPYNISSQVLLRFTKYPSPISLWLCMLQKEMARRISAPPRSADYGALTVLMQAHYRVEYLRTVSASVFLPQPEIDSAFVKLTPRDREEFPIYDGERFEKLVRLGFSQRRKQLQKLLRAEVPEWISASETVGFEPRARAEELSLPQWIELANFSQSGAVAAPANDPAAPFAVVDIDDQVIGSAARDEVHANNSLHRAVHLFIFNRAGELYLQKRSRAKDRHPCLWDSSVSGHVDAGEEYEEAAVREMREEVGVRAQIAPLVKLPASERTGYEFIWLYRVEHEGPFRLAKSEIETGDFFSPSLITAWMEARPADFAPGLVECWKALQNFSSRSEPLPKLN